MIPQHQRFVYGSRKIRKGLESIINHFFPCKWNLFFHSVENSYFLWLAYDMNWAEAGISLTSVPALKPCFVLLMWEVFKGMMRRKSVSASDILPSVFSCSKWCQRQYLEYTCSTEALDLFLFILSWLRALVLEAGWVLCRGGGVS